MSTSKALVPVRQVAAARNQLLAQSGLPFAQHLPADLVHRTCRRLGHVFRQRVFTPAVTLWTFLSQVFDPDHSCRQAVARLLAWRVASGLAPCAADTGAYCRARARLPEEALAQLARQTGQQLHDQADGGGLWQGRPVKVVDGTGLSRPDTPANQREYPQPETIAAGVGFPLLRLVVVFSLSVGTALAAAMGRFRGKGSGEVSLFRQLFDILEHGDVLLADRLYANFWDVAAALGRGADVVMRLHAGRTPIPFGGRGPTAAQRREVWLKPQRPAWMTAEAYEAVPEQIRLRAVRVEVRQKGFRTRRLVLITTLLDAGAVTRDDLADLYRRRWQAELNLRSLKQTLQMDILRGQTPEVVRKEVWAHLLVYNVVRTVMAEAARAAAVRPEEVSFAGALQTLNAFAPVLRSAATVEEWERLWGEMLRAIGSHRVGDRPDRIEPRAVKRRPKNFPKLKEPRKQARRKLKKGAKRVGKKR